MLAPRALAFPYRSLAVRHLSPIRSSRGDVQQGVLLFVAWLLSGLIVCGQTSSVTANPATCSPAGGEITFTVRLAYPTNASVVIFEVKPPGAGWVHRETNDKNLFGIWPGVGATTDPTEATSALGWASFAGAGLPVAAMSFSFVLSYPPGLAGDQTFVVQGSFRADGSTAPLDFAAPSLVIPFVPVGPPPVITPISPARQIVGLGQDLTLDATVTGATRYEWKRNGFPIPGATSPAYTIVGAKPARDNGWYQLFAYSGGGTTASPVVFVGVSVPSGNYLGIGENFYGERTLPEGLGDVTALAGGGAHTVAVKSGGTVAAWGNGNGGRTAVPAALTSVVAVAAGYTFSLALRSDGTVVGWGENYLGQTAIPPGLTGVVAIACGYSHALALKSDGTVVGWGMGASGQTAIPAGLTGVAAIAAGDSHSLALKTNGTIVAWGSNIAGQGGAPGWLTGVVGVTAGYYHNLARRGDGSVSAWGNDFNGEITGVSSLRGVSALAAGASHSLALKEDGTVVGWGYAGAGLATIAGGLPRVAHMAAGGYFNLFLLYPPGDIAPTITRQPVSSVVVPGQTVTFSVGADIGTAPTKFQWRKDGAAIPGATSASYAVSAVVAASAGSFDVTITNYVGSATSEAATLTVDEPTLITASPASVTEAANRTITFRVTASGTPPLVYRWQRQVAGTTEFFDINDNSLYEGVTTANLSVWVIDTMNGYRYRCVVRNGLGITATSESALLTVPSPPAFTSTASAVFFVKRAGSVAVAVVGVPTPAVSIAGLPAWARFDRTTGLISGTPPDTTGSPFVVTLTADNGIGYPVTQVLSLNVRVAHSADVSPADGTLNLAELTRVIALYNTRHGTVRTSRYQVSESTEDGFEFDPTTSGASVVALARYHSADTNRDGRISLTELTRVIQLFNTRSGATRTGAYHVPAAPTATEDGFAPGP